MAEGSASPESAESGAAQPTGAEEVAVQPTGSQTSAKQELSCLAYAGYWTLLFVAHWFGAKRFDADGDGDFDPEDVQTYLAEAGFLKQNFKRPKRKDPKAAAKKRAAEEAAKKKRAAAEEAEGDQEQQEEEEGGGEGGRRNILDQDGDGLVDLDDLIKSDVEGEAQEEVAVSNLASGQVFPWFICFEVTVTCLLWVAGAVKTSTERGTPIMDTIGGLESFAPGESVLRFYGTECQDYRRQVWRWIVYQYTHGYAGHIFFNSVLNCMIGIPLEGLHGWWRMAIMFNIGVLGGAFGVMLLDSSSATVGCSGGCYALLGIMTADLIMNWAQKKFRKPTVAVLSFLVLVDMWNIYSTVDGTRSDAAHLGGAIAGLCIGVVVCKNTHVKAYEVCVKVVLFLIGVGLSAFAVAWLASWDNGPQSLSMAVTGTPGYCWVRQVYHSTINAKNYECVRCGTTECIDSFTSLPEASILSVDARRCASFWHEGR